MKGRKEHTDRLRRASGSGLVKRVGSVLYRGADTIRAEAFRLVSAGSVSGKGHEPSSPGEPPNRDTGNLQAHFVAELVSPLEAQFRSEAEYARIEFGIGNVAERPHIRPARDAKIAGINRELADEINKLVRSR